VAPDVVVHATHQSVPERIHGRRYCEKDGRVEFEKRKPFDDRDPARKKEFQDLVGYLDGTIENLYRFLDAYVVLHRKTVQPSERTKIMLKSLEKGLIKEYAP
jgi:hypothetical protein